jgi:cytochrome oxidase Cu insertion factor (SCO1/SenC/PrrC family)
LKVRPIKALTGLTTVFLAVLPLSASYAHMTGAHGRQVTEPLPQSAGSVEYEPPVPGSYRLPPIQRAADGNVLDSRARRRTLFDLMAGKSALLSFIYTKCSVPGGCPLALGVLNEVRERILADAGLSDKVVLITLSFDPENDTPEVMRKLADALDPGESRAGPPWHFLTTPSRRAILPILEGYGQYVVREIDSAGHYTGGYSHVLKVFLIDPKRRVRNIYSTSFLDPDLIIADIKTLLLEQDKALTCRGTTQNCFSSP